MYIICQMQLFRMLSQSKPNSMRVFSSVSGPMTDKVVNRAATMRIRGEKKLDSS